MKVGRRVGARRRSVARGGAGRVARGRDVLADVVLELSARRARTALIIVAVALSTGALLAAVGISATAARQIGADMAAATLNLLTVTVSPADSDPEAADAAEAADAGVPDAAGSGADADNGGSAAAVGGVSRDFPPDAERRAGAIDLVVAAGRRLEVPQTQDVAVELEAGSPSGDALRLIGLTPGYLDAAGVSLRAGRDWFLSGEENIAILGRRAAERLGVPVSGDPTGHHVRLGRTRYQVVDFLEDSPQAAVDLSTYVVIPYARAEAFAASDANTVMLLRVEPGAGAPVSRVIRTAIRPDAPERLQASQVVSLSTLRRGVDTQLGRLAGGIGAFLLLLTSLLIANAMVVSVTTRTAEIGLRRALGTSRAGVSAVFWCEGLVVGVIGGLTGSALAAAVTTSVAAFNHWSVVMEPWTLGAGPIVGGVVGFLASAYPAMRAARIHPAIAVRSD